MSNGPRDLESQAHALAARSSRLSKAMIVAPGRFVGSRHGKVSFWHIADIGDPSP